MKVNFRHSNLFKANSLAEEKRLIGPAQVVKTEQICLTGGRYGR